MGPPGDGGSSSTHINRLNKRFMNGTNEQNEIRHRSEAKAANSNQLQDHSMSMSQRVSYAWDLLKDIPKSIFLTFILDLCTLKPKDDIEELIKCLNCFISNGNDDAGVNNNLSNKNSGNTAATQIPRKGKIHRKLHNKSGITAATSKPTVVNIHRELYQVIKDQEYWKNVSHSFDSRTTQRLRPRSKTIDGIPKFSDIDADAEQVQSSADLPEHPHFKICRREDVTNEYVCCVNRCKNNGEAMTLLELRNHVYNNHKETWNGKCFHCKETTVSERGLTFIDCLNHVLDKHLDNLRNNCRVTSQQDISKTGNACQSVEESQQTYEQSENDERNTDENEMKYSITISKLEIDDNEQNIEPLRPASSASTLILESLDKESLETEGISKPKSQKPVVAQKVAARNSISAFPPTAANLVKETTKRKLSETASERSTKRVTFATIEAKPNPKNTGTGENYSGFANSPLLIPIVEPFTDLTLSDDEITCDLSVVKTKKGGDEIRNKEQNDWKCDICHGSRIFRNKYSLSDHRLLHYGLKPMTCDLCKKTLYNNNTILRNHEINYHGGQRCSFYKTHIPEGSPVIRKYINEKKKRNLKETENKEKTK